MQKHIMMANATEHNCVTLAILWMIKELSLIILRPVLPAQPYATGADGRKHPFRGSFLLVCG